MPFHVSSSHRIVVDAPAAQAFMFFTPAGEELWVDHWQPHYLQPADGATCAGMVFTTGEGDERTIWCLADFDRERLRSRYVRTTPASRSGTVDIECEALGDDRTQVTVRYEMTALDPQGEASLEAYRGAAFESMIDGWARDIAARLPQLLASPIR